MLYNLFTRHSWNEILVAIFCLFFLFHFNINTDSFHFVWRTETKLFISIYSFQHYFLLIIICLKKGLKYVFKGNNITKIRQEIKNILQPSRSYCCNTVTAMIMLFLILERAIKVLSMLINPHKNGPFGARMDEGRERDNTSRRGGPPTLPGLYHSTIQPSQRGFFRVHVFVWREREPVPEFSNFSGPQASIPRNW